MKNNLFLVWGQEPYLIEEHIRNLTEQINLEQGEEAETIALDADEISPMQLAEILEFSPCFPWPELSLLSGRSG